MVVLSSVIGTGLALAASMRKRPDSGTINAPSKEMLDKMEIQKSRPLLALLRAGFTLPEHKLLDFYLARINPHDPSNRTVTLTKGELEEALGVTRILNKDLAVRLRRMFTPIDLAGDDENVINQLVLFERAYARKDADGRWIVSLTCTESAMRFIFLTENYGYIRYKLKSIVHLGSLYSYALFLYVEANRFKKRWDVDLGELKKVLGCDKDAHYEEFKRFNSKVLGRARDEILEKTLCRFSYTPIREARKVKRIRFEVETLSLEHFEALTELPAPDKEKEMQESYLPIMEDAFAQLALTKADFDQIYQQMLCMPESGYPYGPDGSKDMHLRQLMYLRQVGAKVKRQKAKGCIGDVAGYICAIIKNDVEKAMSKISCDTQQHHSELGQFEREAIRRTLEEFADEEGLGFQT